MSEEQVVMESSSPRPFGEIPGLWLQIFQMTEDFFRREAPRASGSNALISVLIMTAISIVFSTITTLVGTGLQATMVPAEMQGEMFAVTGSAVVYSICCGAILYPVAFYLGSGVLYLIARLFKGEGDFNTQVYLQSLYTVPIGAVSAALSLVNLIPFAGQAVFGLASLFVGAYIFVLTVRMLKVVHNIPQGRAVAVLLAPLIIPVAVACVVVMMLVLMGPTIGEVFSDIISSYP
jgi:hypothetical protein